jgi:hypothetical protein
MWLIFRIQNFLFRVRTPQRHEIYERRIVVLYESITEKLHTIQDHNLFARLLFSSVMHIEKYIDRDPSCKLLDSAG